MNQETVAELGKSDTMETRVIREYSVAALEHKEEQYGFRQDEQLSIGWIIGSDDW